ncbi:MAG: urea ABC transporter permease subunit UrtC [Pseudomonadota bacterium]
MNVNLDFLGGRSGLVSLLVLAAVILVIFPVSMGVDQLTLTGRFLSFGFVAIGLVICWGYGGILSLGQGIFFGIGGYCMAMFLKLEASTPEATAIQTTPGIPDFMDWNRITELPWFWVPFNSLTFTLVAILLLPAAFAYLIGIAMFKRRVSGVYFAIITQALVVILTILPLAQQGYTGGANGITDLRTLKGWSINTDEALITLYFITAILLLVVIMLGKWLLHTKFGRILIAMRDREDRVRFSGYDVANFKAFAFCIASIFSAIGGAMFTLQEGFMSPSLIGIIPSIEFVIFAAVGGRLSLIGAVYGALAVGFARIAFAEAYPELWLFLMGTVFIVVVLFLPYGLAGLYEKYAAKIRDRLPRQPAGAAPSTESSEVRS